MRCTAAGWRWGVLGVTLALAVPVRAAEPVAPDVDGLGVPLPDGMIAVPGKVLLVGSSSIEWGFGPALADDLLALGVEHVRNEGRMATGLSRPDYFDWPTFAAQAVTETHPDLVIAQFGGNDCQALRSVKGKREVDWGDEAWDAAYAERVRALVHVLGSTGAVVVFVGMPHMQEPGFAARIAHVNDLIAATVRAEGGWFVDTWDLTSAADGAYQATFDDHGRTHALRRDDGIHLGKWGAPYIAQRVADRLAARMDLLDACVLRPEDDPRGTCDVDPVDAEGAAPPVDTVGVPAERRVESPG